ncbi:MAG: hypothetical protein U1F52_02220 [Burkholderiales bacterium]
MSRSIDSRPWGAAALVLLLAQAVEVEARVRLGHPPQEHCAAAGCSYVNGKGICVLAADGPDGLAMVLNGTPVKLHRKERLAVFRQSPATRFTPGNRFMSVYDSVESSVGGVRVKILDTVVQPEGACAGDQPDCTVVHYQSRIRIELPRDVIDFRGTGHCPAR